MLPSINIICHFHLVDVFMRMSNYTTCLLATDISLLNDIDRQGRGRSEDSDTARRKTRKNSALRPAGCAPNEDEATGPE